MHDFDDFDEPDDLAALGFPGDPNALLAGSGAGSATRAAALGVSAAARAGGLVSGETGLRFESLVLFAEPLFTHFEMDVADAFAVRERPGDAAPEVVAMLEAARLLWAFFELPPPERARRRSVLAAHLLGTEPSDEDWVEIEAVLDAVEPYWMAMLPEERAEARQPGRDWLGWAALMAHPSFQLDGAAGEAARGIGPDGLSDLEARALFAQPLIEEAAAAGDVDAVEAAMDRAGRYWQIARLPREDREAALDEAIGVMDADPHDRADLEQEARQMLDRYDGLFAS